MSLERRHIRKRRTGGDAVAAKKVVVGLAPISVHPNPAVRLAHPMAGMPNGGVVRAQRHHFLTHWGHRALAAALVDNDVFPRYRRLRHDRLVHDSAMMRVIMVVVVVAASE